MGITANQAWNLYLNIEKVVYDNREGLPKQEFMKKSDIDKAVQYLCQAVLLKYNLEKNNHRQFIYKPFYIDKENLDLIDLSTTKAMINAKIPIWLDRVVPEQAGYDSWTKGQDAGYFPQDSLQKNLGRNYFELEAILNMTAESAFEMYKSIQNAVYLQLKRVQKISDSPGITRDKTIEIVKSLKLLRQAVIMKYKLSKDLGDDETAEMIEKSAHLKDLYSFDSMLDATFALYKPALPAFTHPKAPFGREAAYVKQMSLRQALNIGRFNPLNLFVLQEVLWGKSTALEEVEKHLNILV